MLRKLSIRNYALIRELDLSFNSGLNIMTGETGAGKSIIIGALGLILGNRADLRVLNDKKEKCLVEAVFDMDYHMLSQFFEKNDIDIEEYVIIRRQINPLGKSRAFINDTPVKLPVLRELTSLLIDVNAQQQTYSLNDASIQLQLLDDYADLNVSVEAYQKEFRRYSNLKNKLKLIEEQEGKARLEKDFLQFQFDELEQADLVENEFAKLEEELEIMTHSEEIKRALFETDNALQSEVGGSINGLINAINSLQSIKNYHNDYKVLFERLQSLLVEMQDIQSELAFAKEQIEFDPAMMEAHSNRIDLLIHLQQKHHLSSVDDLIEFKESLEQRLLNYDNIEIEKSSLQKEINNLFDKITKLADEIHDKRRSVVEDIEVKVIKSLSDLGMNAAQFSIELRKFENLNEKGRNAVQFLFSANKGVDVAPISKVASGGELSRLMLTLKYILTSKKSLSTIIFDEIDTGVSGDIAGMVGDMMKKMGNKMQIIAITHLPQIAGKAQSHFKVYKQIIKEKTYSSIRLLNEQERIEELTLMISGKKKSKAAAATARELMEL